MPPNPRGPLAVPRTPSPIPRCREGVTKQLLRRTTRSRRRCSGYRSRPLPGRPDLEPDMPVGARDPVADQGHRAEDEQDPGDGCSPPAPCFKHRLHLSASSGTTIQASVPYVSVGSCPADSSRQFWPSLAAKQPQEITPQLSHNGAQGYLRTVQKLRVAFDVPLPLFREEFSSTSTGRQFFGDLFNSQEAPYRRFRCWHSRNHIRASDGLAAGCGRHGDCYSDRRFVVVVSRDLTSFVKVGTLWIRSSYR